MNTELITTAQAPSLQAAGYDAEALAATFANSQDVHKRTRDHYRRTLAGFFAWTERTGRHISELTAADLVAYKEALLEEGKTSLTIGNYINTLRCFYEWAEANKLYPNIAKTLHAPKRVRLALRKQPLSVRKVGELLGYMRGTQSSRDYAMLNLMVRTGLRCIEVSRANIEDITTKTDEQGEPVRVLMVQGKGHDDRDSYVILTDAAYKPIADYLRTRPGASLREPLFASRCHHNQGGRMTTRAISSIAKEALKAIGLEDRTFTAHSLRYTAGVNILRSGGSIEQAQFTLRHSNPATTQIYTYALRDEQRLTTGGEYLLDKLYSAQGIY